MGLPTGLQDHIPALLGGLLAIAHEPGGERVERIETDFEALARSLVVAYTGQSHFSAGNNWRVVRRRLERDAETVAGFEEIARIAGEVVEAFRESDLAAVGHLMSQEWRCRQTLAEGISTPGIEAILEAALGAGAWGGKACGAGGGGCVALLVPAERRDAVLDALDGIADVLPAVP